MCVFVCVSLQAEALGVGDGDGQLVFELLPGSVWRQTDLVETGVRDRQPEEREGRGVSKSSLYLGSSLVKSSNCF